MKSMTFTSSPNTVRLRETWPCLKQWTGDTSLASFVDRQTNVPLSKARVVCYDTEGLRASPQLQSVGTFLMSQFAWRRVLARNGQNTLVIVDEADVILKDNRAGKPFMEDTFARFRKTGSGIWAISQTLEHFRDMPTIGNNIHHLLLFKSNADERKRLQAHFNLPQHLVDLATQVTNSKGHYSEALCLVKKGDVFQGNIIALHPTQLDYWTFTTDSQDKARREEMLGQNGTLQQAVKQLEAA
jgi:conjugal transfer ATP-binding protein TraC